MRRLLLALAVLVPTLQAVPPASAAPVAVVFAGTWEQDCFGCNWTYGRGELTLVGTHNGLVHAEFTAYEGGGALCLLSGEANGHFSGALETNFNWTRVGGVVLMTLGAPGSTSAGLGFGLYVPPVGALCGTGPVQATVAGTIVGNL